MALARERGVGLTASGFKLILPALSGAPADDVDNLRRFAAGTPEPQGPQSDRRSVAVIWYVGVVRRGRDTLFVCCPAGVELSGSHISHTQGNCVAASSPARSG